MATEQQIQEALHNLNVLLSIKYASFVGIYSWYCFLAVFILWVFWITRNILLFSPNASILSSLSIKQGLIVTAMTAIPSFSDLMAWLLLKKVGTSFDPSNPFMAFTFIWTPLALALVQFVMQQILIVSRGVSGGPITYEVFGTAFTFGPLYIAGHAYGLI